MDGRMLARLVVVIVAAVAIVAADVHRAREEIAAGALPSPPATEATHSDPLRATLQRCQRIGEAATRDVDCLAAWDQNRRRFLAPATGN
ncbi:putative entry exclusion protein TrbK-alt [Mesorhizobium sp. M1406]|uniref:putative entry exclusion protein TrbK-alt n=1 Tax=Mesorhizobium sp. M1406 TaxID=2957099 RepID=UPI003336D196